MSSKSKHILIQPPNSTPIYITKNNENIYPHKNVYKNGHSKIFLIAKKLKQLRCPSTDG